MNYATTISSVVILSLMVMGITEISSVSGQIQSKIDIQKGASSSSDASCVMLANCFSPNPANVLPGTTIIWKNLDSVSHSITSVDSKCNGPHFTIVIETDNKKVDPTVMVRTSFTQITYAKLAQYQPYATDNLIAPIRKLVYEAYVSPSEKSFEVVVVEGIGRNTFSVHKTVNVSGCNVGSLFDSGVIKPDNIFEFTFSDTGSYNYFCMIHPWLMGQIVVKNPTYGKQSNLLQSSKVGPTNATAQAIIPEFPVSIMMIIVVGFVLLVLIPPLVNNRHK